MNAVDLAERVAAEHGVSKEHAKKLIDSVFGAITKAALGGEEVALNGFGRFKVTDRAEHQGRNPVTGEALTIAASKKLSFTPAKAVREALNTATPREIAPVA